MADQDGGSEPGEPVVEAGVEGLSNSDPEPDRDDAEKEQHSMVLIGSTEVAPAVLWPNGRPENAGTVYGAGEAAGVVAALEMLLPAGWTIWAPEKSAALGLLADTPVVWHGYGRVWPEVVETLAQQHGIRIAADVVGRRADITLLSPGGRSLSPSHDANSATRAEGGDTTAIARPKDLGNRLYRQYSQPAKLTAEPLPDTLGRVAWRFAPMGVQLDLSELGAYVNSPVFHWDLDGVSISPRSALNVLMPTGYCLDDTDFPMIVAAVCADEREQSGEQEMTEQ